VQIILANTCMREKLYSSTFHKVVQQHILGEVVEFVYELCRGGRSRPQVLKHKICLTPLLHRSVLHLMLFVYSLLYAFYQIFWWKTKAPIYLFDSFLLEQTAKLNVQYTPPTPTRLSCRVESRRRCEQNSQLAHDDCRRVRSTNWPSKLHSGLTT